MNNSRRTELDIISFALSIAASATTALEYEDEDGSAKSDGVLGLNRKISENLSVWGLKVKQESFEVYYYGLRLQTVIARSLSC